MSSLVRALAVQIKAIQLPKPELEHRFHPTRRWRIDLAWPDILLGVEVEGGVYTRGRHLRPLGFEADVRKYDEAALMGWIILRVTRKMIESGEALGMIERAFGRTKELGWSA